MLEVERLIFQQPMTISLQHSKISTQYPMMVIGGAEDKVNECGILAAFFESAGGKMATIGIMPCASQEPVVVGDRYYQIFRKMGAANVQVLDIRERNECDEPRWLDILDKCTGIFMTGGDQLRLHDLIDGSKFIALLKQRLHFGNFVVAGTSAGAAIVGEKMISGGSSGESPHQALVDLTEGLGFLPELIVDQHFHNRNRMARLLSAIAANPDKLGIGIDEDTCAAFRNNGTFEVLGKGTITIVDPGKLTYTNHPEATETAPLSLHNLSVHVLTQGDCYDYKHRTVLMR